MADTVTISKASDTHIHIRADRSVLKELWSEFAYQHPNAEYIQSYRDRRWDGKIRLFDMRSGKMLLGLHTLVAEYCRQQGYEVVYEDPLDAENAFSVDEFKRLIKELKLSTMNDGTRESITPHDYQQRGVIHAIQAGRSLLLSATSSGKSLIIYILLRYYFAKTKKKILIIVPSTTLVRQLYGDFMDYATYTDWNVEENCHQIYDGGEKRTNKRVTISTWQALAVKERLPKEILAEMKQEYSPSMYKKLVKDYNKQAPYILEDEYFEEFGVVFGDECHLFSSEDSAGGGELQEIMSKLVNAKYRIGTTGSLKDAKVHHMVLEGLFGKVYEVISARELIDQGKAADLQIKCLQLQYSDEERKFMRKKTYQEEMDFLLSHNARNKFIRNLALSLNGNTLVLFERVEKHGHILHEMIGAKIAEGRKLFYVHGQTATDDRNEVRAITEGETDAIIVASYGTFSTGINIRNINNIIFASPTKAKIRVLQSIGRGLRLSKRKTEVRLYDISDDLSISNKSGVVVHDNYSLLHFSERVNIYNSERHYYKLFKIFLEGSE